MPTYKVTADSVDSIKQALLDYQEIYSDPFAKRSRFEIFHGQEAGAYVINVDQIDDYHLFNLVGWLAAPPDLPSVKNACGWGKLKSETAFLVPDTNNEAGDTLLGINATGQTFQVHQPTATVSKQPVETLTYLAPAEGQGKMITEVVLSLQTDDSPSSQRSGCLGFVLLFLISFTALITTVKAESTVSEELADLIFSEWRFQRYHSKRVPPLPLEELKVELAEKFKISKEQLNRIIQAHEAKEAQERLEANRESNAKFYLVVTLAIVNIPVYFLFGWAMEIKKYFPDLMVHSNSWKRYTLGYNIAFTIYVLFIAGCVSIVGAEYYLILQFFS